MYPPISGLQISIPIISLLFNMTTQIICFRFFPRFGLLKSEYSGFIMGFFLFILLEYHIFSTKLLMLKDSLPLFMVNLIIYLAFAFLYFTFVNLGETARRIRILTELFNSKDGLTIDELIQHYNAAEIIDKRLNRLVDNRQIICKNGRYYISGRVMLLIARIILMMKRMCLLY